jgi:hypothetical protein
MVRVAALLILRTFVRNDIMKLINFNKIFGVRSGNSNALKTRFIQGAVLLFFIYDNETTYMHTRALLSASTRESMARNDRDAGICVSIP